jgi:hypothetical protein
VLLAALAALACLLLVWFVSRRIARRPSRAELGGLSPEGEPDNTPRGRLLALACSIREALTAQYGAPWRAKTTEELSAESQLEHVLGSEGRQELIRFLDQIDRLKFASERSNHREESLEAELAIWQPRLTALKKRIEDAPAGRLNSKSAVAASANSEGALRA